MNEKLALNIASKLISYPTITPKELDIYAYIESILPEFTSIRLDKNGVKNIFLYKLPNSNNKECVDNNGLLSNVCNDTNGNSHNKHESDAKIDSISQIIHHCDEQSDKTCSSFATNLHSQIHNDEIKLDSKNKKMDCHSAIAARNDDMADSIHPMTIGLKSTNTKPHICFAGHIDVVAPGGNYESKESSWEFHPFTPTIKDSYLCGRGAQDMKGGIACFLDSIKEFSKHANYTISILLTSDEEGDAIYGTKHVLEILKEKNMLPTHCIVAEPTSSNIAGDTIKIGRRGSINGVINIKGKQGHVAYPSLCINPVELLGERLGKLAGVDLDNGSEFFDTSKLVITDIRGGLEVVNVTPNNLKIMFNVRNSTATSLDSIKLYIEKVLSGLPFTLELKESAKSFITNNERFISLLESSIDSIYKDLGLDIKAQRSTSGGTSDARFFAEYGIDVAEIGVCNDKIHAINERVKVQDIEILREIFLKILRNFNDYAK